MKRLFLFLCIWGSALAEPQPLPPVIDNSSYADGSSYRSRSTSNQSLLEMLNRLDQLQIEVQQLRGQIEEQTYSIEQMRKRQQNIYTDLDQRLQKLEGGGLPAARPAPVKARPAPAARPAAAKKTSAGEKKRYQQAYDKLRNGHYSQAISQFKQLLADYPGGEYADNAQYWLGEAYKVNRDTEAARRAFSKLISDYPDSPKVPDGMLKLGFIEAEQKHPGKAREYLKALIKRYPGTTAVHLAEKKLQQLGDVKSP